MTKWVTNFRIEPSLKDLKDLGMHEFEYQGNKIKFKKHTADESDLEILADSPDKAEESIKYFLGVLGLSTKNQYSYKFISSKELINGIQTDGIVDRAIIGRIQILDTIKEKDKEFLEYITNSIHEISKEESRKRIKISIQLIHNAMNSYTSEQAILTAWTATHYLASHIAHGTSSSCSEAISIERFLNKGIINENEKTKKVELKEKLKRFHKARSDSLWGAKEKTMDQKEALEIFKEFLEAYIQYNKTT